MNEITLQDRGGIPVVSSRDVAENFGKQHQHITQSIENLISEKSLLKTMLIEQW